MGMRRLNIRGYNYDVFIPISGQLIPSNKYGKGIEAVMLQYNDSTLEIYSIRMYSCQKGDVLVCSGDLIINENIKYWRFVLQESQSDNQHLFNPQPFELIKDWYSGEFGHSKLTGIDFRFPIIYYFYRDDGSQSAIRMAEPISEFPSYSQILHFEINKQGELKTVINWQSKAGFTLVSLPTKANKIAYTQEHTKEYLTETNTIKYKCKRKKYDVLGDEQIVEIGTGPGFTVNMLLTEQLIASLKKDGVYIENMVSLLKHEDQALGPLSTINFHLIKACDMRCKHCFSDFSEIEYRLTYEDAATIVKQAAGLQGVTKINFSGGEPTLFKDLPGLIGIAKSCNVVTSLVSNGFRFVKEKSRLEDYEGRLDMLVLSIDSVDSEANVKIGRHVTKKTISEDEYISLAKKAVDMGMKVKINTVVTSLNYDSCLHNLICKIQPVRWKILRMLPVGDQNDNAKSIEPDDNKFNHFIDINKTSAEESGTEVTIESNDDMKGGYLMISPDGRFFNNVFGKHGYSKPIVNVGIQKALETTPFFRERFYSRGGLYTI